MATPSMAPTPFLSFLTVAHVSICCPEKLSGNMVFHIFFELMVPHKILAGLLKTMKRVQHEYTRERISVMMHVV